MGEKQWLPLPGPVKLAPQWRAAWDYGTENRRPWTDWGGSKGLMDRLVQ